jgi:hypothetical protein
MTTAKQKAARAKFAKLARKKHKGSAVGKAAASSATPKVKAGKGKRKQSPAQKAAFKKMLAARRRTG